MFDPLEPRPSAVDECEAAIRHAIVTGAALPGTRLPPERKLAEDFGVNRVTVRTALSRLAAANLLRVRQGSGYVVQDFRAVGGPELIPELFPDAAPLAASLDVVADLLAVRRQLARTALERLVARAASDGVDLAPVQRAIDRLAALAATRADDRALADADLAVVGALLDATGSTVLKLCLNPVQRVIRALAPLRAAIYAAPETNVAAYRALLALLASGAPAAAVDRVAALLAERDAATLRKLATHPAAEDAPAMTTPRPLPLWSYLLVDPRAVAASLDRIRAAGLVPDVPNLWQVSLGVARMVHRLLFRPDSVGLSTDAPARTSLRARLLRVRPLRFPFLLAAGAVTPLDLSGLASPRDRVMAHLLGAHHDRRQFVYDLQILAAHPGALEELLARARAVASGDDPRAAWLKDLVVYEGYHERLVAAVRAALDGEHGLTPEEAADPDVSFLAYLRWCAAQPASPAATWRALRAGEFALDRDRLGVAA